MTRKDINELGATFQSGDEATPAESSVVGGAKSGFAIDCDISQASPAPKGGGRGACAPLGSHGLARNDVMQCSPRSLISSAALLQSTPTTRAA